MKLTNSLVTKTNESVMVQNKPQSKAFDIRSLSQGTVFRGTITDIRNDRVVIQLSEKDFVSARFQEAVDVCIGDMLQFLVQENKDNLVVIKPFIPNQMTAYEQTLYKALEAAGLMATDKNIDVVSALLTNGMSVDKETIQYFLSLSYANPTADINDLMLMVKNKIDITPENLEQILKLHNKEHQITKNILTLVDQLSATKDILVPDEISREALINHWTIRPEQLNKDQVNNTFSNLNEQMTVLMERLKTMETPDKVLEQSATNVKNNLNFMQNLTDTLLYTQLPLQLSKQMTNGELYVFSKKREFHPSEEINLLFHLDMDHLGSLDINLTMQNNKIRASFFVEDADVAALLKENMPFLTTALQAKNYILSSDVKQSKKDEHFDLIKDVLDGNHSITPIGRYSFDIRV